MNHAVSAIFTGQKHEEGGTGGAAGALIKLNILSKESKRNLPASWHDPRVGTKSKTQITRGLQEGARVNLSSEGHFDPRHPIETSI